MEARIQEISGVDMGRMIVVILLECRTYSQSNTQPSRLPPKKLVFVLTQGNPDETLFAECA